MYYLGIHIYDTNLSQRAVQRPMVIVCYEPRVIFLYTWTASDIGHSLPPYGRIALHSFLPVLLVLIQSLDYLFDYQQSRRAP